MDAATASSSFTLPSIHSWSACQSNYMHPMLPTFLVNGPLILPKPGLSPCSEEASKRAQLHNQSEMEPSSASLSPPLHSPSSLESSPTPVTVPRKTKRGRKPCANPTPQALRQRAYRLRKQMKKQQALKEKEAKELNTKIQMQMQSHAEDGQEELHAAEILLRLSCTTVLSVQ